MSDGHGTVPPSEQRRREAFGLREVAAMLGCSYSSVYRWARDGTLPAVRIGHRVFVPRTAVEDLLGTELD